jgi:glycogen debranching enzyme
MSKRMNDYEKYKKFKAIAESMIKQVNELYWIEELELFAAGLDENNTPNVGSDDLHWGEVQETYRNVAYHKMGEKSKVIRALSRWGEGYPSRYYEPSWPGFYMPIIAGLAAVGEFNYGRVEQGLILMRTIAETVGHIMPGAIPETVQWGEPDKFHPGWNYLQLWSAAKVPQGLVCGLLRIEPDAANNKVVMQPQLPKDWPYVDFRNIIIGKSKINVRLEKDKTVVNQISGPKLEIIL